MTLGFDFPEDQTNSNHELVFTLQNKDYLSAYNFPPAKVVTIQVYVGPGREIWQFIVAGVFLMFPLLVGILTQFNFSPAEAPPVLLGKDTYEHLPYDESDLRNAGLRDFINTPPKQGETIWLAVLDTIGFWQNYDYRMDRNWKYDKMWFAGYF